MDKIDKILKKLTLEEKFKLIHGNSFWLFNSYTKELKDVFQFFCIRIKEPKTISMYQFKLFLKS